MPNDFFRFKQFTINQEKSAMKVGTDGVLLACWTHVATAENILDIGTGTGLIAIAMAQRSPATIDAVEIDDESYWQALENIANCKWKHRISVYHNSIQEFARLKAKKYDCIISNPPFFNNAFKSAEAKKNISKHTDLLSYTDLVVASSFLLTDNGRFNLILPYTEGLLFIENALEHNLFLSRKTSVLPCPWKPAHRLLMEFTKQAQILEENTLTIELNTRHHYSDEYKELTKDFYL